MYCHLATDKETDESWNIFIIGKINSGFGADYEQLLRPVFYVFMGKK
jgi:hypothetical protein